MKKPKKGERYVNWLGEYCVVKSIYRDRIRLQMCGKKARTEIWKLSDFKSPLIGRFSLVPFPKINRTNISRYLLEYQLNMIGKTTAHTKENPNWFREWTISERDFMFFKGIAIPLLKKIFKFNKQKAEKTFDWFNMQFGLTKIL